MTITANYIDTGTIQITNYWEPTTGGEVTYHTFNDLAETISDAITGTASGNAGATSGITFTASAGITPIASTGWTLADSFWGYSTKSPTRDATTTSPIFTQVFKSPCADGNSTKNIIIRYNTLTQEILTTTCEKYTVATRVITNEAWTFADCAPVHYNLSYSDIIVMVNPRFLVLHSYIATAPDLWSGVFECAREDVNDVAGSGYPDTNGTGYPCWGWMGSTSMGLGTLDYNKKTFGQNSIDAGPLWSMPRLMNGNVGANAAINFAINIGIDTYPSAIADNLATLAPSNLRSILRTIVDTPKYYQNKWSVNKLTLPIKPIAGYRDTNSGNYGQIYGAKLLYPLGYNMNMINITVDSDNNGSATGTSKRHWLLNTHQKCPLATNYKESGQWTTDLIGTTGSVRGARHLSIGSAIYIIGNSGSIGAPGATLMKFNRFTRVLSKPTLNSFNSYIYDMVFDGERYIYITRASNATMYRYDIVTESVSSVSTAAALGFLGINGNAIYASLGVDTSSSYMFRFTRQASSGTVSAIAAHPTNPTTVTIINTGTARQYGMKCDFDGRLFYLSTLNTDATLRYVDTNGSGPATLFTGTSSNITNYLILDGKYVLFNSFTSGSTCSTYMYNIAGSQIGTGVTSNMISNTRGDYGMFKYHGMAIISNNNAQNTVFAIQYASTPLLNTFDNTSCTTLSLTAGEGYPYGTGYDSFSWNVKSYGGEIMASTQFGVNVFQNINCDNSIGGFTTVANKLAQVAIPA